MSKSLVSLVLFIAVLTSQSVCCLFAESQPQQDPKPKLLSLLESNNQYDVVILLEASKQLLEIAKNNPAQLPILKDDLGRKIIERIVSPEYLARINATSVIMSPVGYENNLGDLAERYLRLYFAYSKASATTRPLGKECAEFLAAGLKTSATLNVRLSRRIKHLSTRDIPPEDILKGLNLQLNGANLFFDSATDITLGIQFQAAAEETFSPDDAEFVTVAFESAAKEIGDRLPKESREKIQNQVKKMISEAQQFKDPSLSKRLNRISQALVLSN